MPIDPSIISAGSGIISAGLNTYGQLAVNQSQQNFALGLYGMQRKAALEDWDRQNAYNSPAAQMQRLRDAGLNPNLVYGHGADAMSTSPVRSSSPGQYSPRAPQFDLQSIANNALAIHYDMQIKKQTVDNLKAQNDAIKNRAALDAVNTKASLAGIPVKEAEAANKNFDLFMKNQLAPGSLEMQQAQIRNIGVRTDVALDANERAQAMLAPNLAIAAQKIVNMRLDALRQQADTAKSWTERKMIQSQMDMLGSRQMTQELENRARQLDLQLRQQGINPHDPTWLRVLARLFMNISDSVVEKP